MGIAKNGRPITDLADWGNVAGPKTTTQWVPGRSALEAARFWLAAGSDLPTVFSEPLRSHADFGTVVAWSGEPEVRLTFDQRRGEPRNTDLLLECHDSFGAYLLAVEAKADEPFGQTVATAAADALDRRTSNSRSAAYERVVDLVLSLLPPAAKGLPAARLLRYQLLTATAGALAEAARRRCDRVVLAVQEFKTDITRGERQRSNQRDLDAFLTRLTAGSVRHLSPGSVIGPVSVPGGPLFAKPARLYFLKVVCDQRKA